MTLPGVPVLLSAIFWAAFLTGAPQAVPEGYKLIQASDCSSCHAADRVVSGPSYLTIAKGHAAEVNALERLATKIREGGSEMPAHANLTDAQRTEIAKWILSLAADPLLTQTVSNEFPHKLKDGTTVNLEFSVYAGGVPPKVTKEVFHGYQLFNSYCYRCHGTDATGGQLAPDLRRSLLSGMNRPGFASAVVTGKKDKGMPAWEGFLSGDDIVHIYQYVKGRSLDLVPSGRPPSTQD
jgi:cytochrome c